jgi:hypothetical protein
VIIWWDLESGDVLSKTDKQGDIILSVDVNKQRPDMISASLLSDELKTWALSGIQETSWSAAFPDLQGSGSDKAQISAGKQFQYPENENIEIFSPSLSDGIATVSENHVFIVGKVSDQEGINSLLVNQKRIRPSDAGVFEIRLNLVQNENPVRIVAINNQGKESVYDFLIFCTSSEAGPSVPILPDIERGRYFALIIGINEYDDPQINDLDKPIEDATALHQVLKEKYTFNPDQIIFLKNPKRSEMIVALERLGRSLTADDNLLIFYAGHGHWDEKGNVGYWLPSDAASDNSANWFRNSTLRDFVGSIQTRHTLLIADACFSGAIFKTRAAFTDASRGIQKLYEIPSRKAMTSGILQEVPDISVFLNYLIKRLEENEKKYLPSESLFTSFKTAVMNNSPNVPQFGVIQNVGDEGGDFIFISRDKE